MTFSEALPALRAALAAEGFNHVGVLDFHGFLARHGAVFRPPARTRWPRSIVVLASGGGAMWAAFQVFLRKNPSWAGRRDPLDDWTAHAVGRALGAALPSGVRAEALYPFRPAWGRPVPFQRMARESGLGVPSKLGTLIHPEFGPWFGLRAAILTDLALAPTAPLGASPCEGCPAPCVPACPFPGAMTEAGWSMARCQEAKLAEPACRARCDARAACVVGVEHRYADDEIAHHYGRLTERLEAGVRTYRKLTFGLLPSSLLLRTYFFTLGRIFSRVSR